VVVVAVCGEVDWCTGPPLRDAVLAQVRPAAPALVIDLTDVEFFGAAGLTVLIAVRDAAKAARIRLSVIAHARVVLLSLTITGLDRMFDIYPALADAPPFRGDGPDGRYDHA
jgi:anti-anti-sigma factor